MRVDEEAERNIRDFGKHAKHMGHLLRELLSGKTYKICTGDHGNIQERELEEVVPLQAVCIHVRKGTVHIQGNKTYIAPPERLEQKARADCIMC